MPLDKFVLILVCVIAAAGVTIWIGALAAAAWQAPMVVPVALIPAGLIVFIGWRVIADRLRNSEDDHYDSIDK